MATTTQEPTATDRIFGALGDQSAVLLGVARSANERAFRATKALLEDAEQNRLATLELGKKIVQEPTNLVGISNLAFDKLSEAQNRAIELGRRAVRETFAVFGETRSNAGELVKASREAAGGASQVARDVYGRTSDAARAAVEAGLSAPVVEKVKAAGRRVASQDEAA